MHWLFDERLIAQAAEQHAKEIKKVAEAAAAESAAAIREADERRAEKRSEECAGAPMVPHGADEGPAGK